MRRAMRHPFQETGHPAAKLYGARNVCLSILLLTGRHYVQFEAAAVIDGPTLAESVAVARTT